MGPRRTRRGPWLSGGVLWLCAAVAGAGNPATGADSAAAKAASTQPSPDPAPAATLLRFEGIRWRGLPSAIEAQVSSQLRLARLKRGTGITAIRFDYLLRSLPRELDLAVQPFGYYSAEVELEPQRDATRASLTATVRLGDPVRVRNSELRIDGAGGSDRSLQAALAAFRPAPGEPLQHGHYEDSKAAVQRKLAERGYFDSQLVEARVEVTRALAAADLSLHWSSGRRYRFGDTVIVGSGLRDDLLRPLLPYSADDRFHQRRLLELQRILAELDYFQRIAIQPSQRDDAAGGDTGNAEPSEPAIGIRVELSPAPRNVYRAGAGFGTDSGVSVNLGYDRRWLNAAGHKFSSDVLLGQERSVATARYRIPAFERYTGWWSAALNLRREPFASLDSDVVELLLAREASFHGNQIVLGLHAQRERFNREGETLVYPQAEFSRVQSDDALYPRRGFRLKLLTRWGLAALGSDVDFLQWLGSAAWIRGIGDADRLLLRAEAGTIRSNEFASLPPSLRFYAGGDRSVRGYGYQELSPRVEGNQRTGGKHLLVASAEWEHMFSARWGGAVFVDAGNAFERNFQAALGVGVGLRWRSPVGPVRVDLGHGFDQPDQVIRLHVQLGPEL